MAKVFKRKYRNGEFSSTYFFKATIDGKRRNFNTESANRKEAERIAKYYETHNVLIQAKLTKPDTVVSVIEETGWMIPSQNPKLKVATTEGRNYGLTQAKNIASAFNHMFNKIEDLGEWRRWIHKNKILRSSSFLDYETFISKPAHQLTHQDAINFISFLEEYTSYLKENPLNKNHKYFMRQNKMNIVALKAFYTHTVDVLNDKRVPVNIFAGRRIPLNKSPKTKNFFDMEQLKIIFNDDFANFIIKDFADSHIYKALKFSALTGMRSGEVRALHYSQFNRRIPNILTINKAFKENVVKKDNIGLPKWDKTRVIYLCDSALELVGEIPSYDDFVFKSHTGRAIPSGGYIRMFRFYLDLIERAYNDKGISFLGGKTYSPHSLRGGLNSFLLGSGEVKTHLIQDYFGWTKKDLTQVQKNHYTKFAHLDSFKVARAIEKGFSGRDMVVPSSEKRVGLADIAEEIMREGKPVAGFHKDTSRDWGTFDYADEIYPKR